MIAGIVKDIKNRNAVLGKSWTASVKFLIILL